MLRNTSTGAVDLQYDSTTLTISSNKLAGNYKASGCIKLSSGTYSLNYDTDKFKVNSSNQLTTIDPVITVDKGLTLTTSTNSTTKVKTYTFSAKLDDITLMFDADKKITIKYPATVYYYPFTLKAYNSVTAGRTAVKDTNAEFETLYLIQGSTYRSMLFAGEYVDLDSNLNFVRRVNNIMGYNFKGIDYRATCTATSFGTLCRNTAATHNTTYRTVNLSNMKL